MKELFCYKLDTCLGQTTKNLCSAEFACFSVLKEDYNKSCIVQGCFDRKEVEFNCKNKTNEEITFNDKAKVFCCNNENFCNELELKLISENQLIMVTFISFLLILAISFFVFFLIKRKKNSDENFEYNCEDEQFQKQSFFKNIKLTELIGKGRYGEVWKGMHFDQPVAVKKFFEIDLESWKRECNIYKINCLNRDAVLKCKGWGYGHFNFKIQYWIVLEYHSLGSLYDFLEDKTLSRHQVLSIIRSIISGITHLHDNYKFTINKPGIAHRDLKSKNIMMKNYETVCIADFGLSITSEEINDKNEIKVFVGTRRYMAPEILNNTLNVNFFESFELADIYSISLVFWEIINQSEFNHNLKSYNSPYYEYTKIDPTVEEMKKVVVVNNLRPNFPDKNKLSVQYSEFNLQVLEKIFQLIQTCWNADPLKRKKALYIMNFLENLKFD